MAAPSEVCSSGVYPERYTRVLGGSVLRGFRGSGLLGHGTGRPGAQGCAGGEVETPGKNVPGSNVSVGPATKSLFPLSLFFLSYE